MLTPLAITTKLLLTTALGLGLLCASAGAQVQDEVGLTYDPAGGVAMEWIAPDVLAVASDGGLRVFDMSAPEAVLLPSPMLALRPVLDRLGDRLAGVTSDGVVVQWRIGTWEELGRRRAFGALPKGPARDLLALMPDERSFIVGDGMKMLAAIHMDDPMPRPLSYPGPKGIEELRFDEKGELRILPSGWVWSLKDGSWRPGKQQPFHSGGGRNHMVWDVLAGRTASFRYERPLELNLTSEAGPVGIDLGYREAMDMDITTDRAIVSFPGVEQQEGYGTPELSNESILGTLESYDAKTGQLLAVLPREGALLSPNESLTSHTLGLGLRIASLGGGGFASVDFVEDHGRPTLYLRFRGPDLLAVAELKLPDNSWPVYLAAGGDLLAVCYPEQRVDVYQLEDGYLPKSSGATASEQAGLVIAEPIASVEISPLGEKPMLDKPAAETRNIFAVREDGGLLAMTGPDGNVSFADPRSGWPNQVVSVRLPKGCGRPLAARFSAMGELIVTGQEPESGLNEWKLDPTLTLWDGPKAVQAHARVSDKGDLRAEIKHGQPGNIDCRGAGGELLWRANLSLAGIDAMAISPDGGVAVAADGNLLYLRASMLGASDAAAPAGDEPEDGEL